MAINIKRVVSNFKTTLSSSITDTATSMTLAAVPAGTIQYPNWFVIEPKSANFEIVYCPTAPSGTTFSGIIRGVSASADTDAAGTGLSHPANVDVVLAPMHRMHNSMADVFNGVSAAPAVMLNPTARTISDPRHLVDMEYVASLTAGAVAAFLVTQNGADPSLTINVNAGQFIVKDGTTALFAGSAAAAVTPSATNYVELNPNTNALSVNTSAFTTNNIPLAIVTTNGTDITAIADRRAWLSQNDGLVDKVRTWTTAQTHTAAVTFNGVTTVAAGLGTLYVHTPTDPGMAVNKLYVDGSGTSGEAITAGQAIYVKASDGKLYKTDTDLGDESTFSFIGFALNTVAAADLTVYLALPGKIVTGLTGLVAGTYYFLSNTAGAIATTPGDRYAKVAQAISTTSIRVIEPKFIRTGTITLNGNGTFTGTTGFYPKNVRFFAAANSTTVSGGSTGEAALAGAISGACLQIKLSSATQVAAINGNHYNCYNFNTSVQYSTGTVTAVSSTGFTVTNSSHNGQNVDLFWIAEN